MLNRFRARLRPWLPILAVTLLCSALAGGAAAQPPDVGAMSGTVIGPDGRPIASAAVVARSEATGALRAGTTDGSGRFSLAGLALGTYTVEVTAPGFDVVQRKGIVVLATGVESVDFRLKIANVSETVTVSEALPEAAVAAASQGSLTGRSAQSLISNEFIRNYTSPFSDYSQTIQMAPSAFSVGTNGPGGSDTKTFFRGFKDGYYSMTFDGIPFNDTNDPTHHSWVFFPAQTIGSVVFDRSPGSAAVVGPSTFGGSVNLISRSLPSRPVLGATASWGSFNTRLFDLQLDSGRFGGEGKSRLLLEGHVMKSDGYQTFNYQKRLAFSGKYQYAASDSTVITAFASVMDLHSNTPNQKGATRAQIRQFGDDFLMSADANSPLYYKFNFYHIPTHFEYVGVRTELGGGWSLDDKAYTMGYHNKQNFNGLTSITATSATDKLNSYWKVGDILPLTHVSNLGIFRTGVWIEYASTDRFQTPSDPRTWVDAPLPNFHEKFGTTTLQPFAEYQVRVGPRLSVAPGLKYARYTQDFTQFADNGKTVGNLGGAPFVEHTAHYNAWLPSLDAHFLVQPYWSVYAQYGKGQNIPPSSVFDVKNAQVGVPPKPVRSDTYQAGTVWKSNRATLDLDAYRITFQNDYSSTLDPVSGDTIFHENGSAVTKGVELESTILVGRGFSAYLNATASSAKYKDSGLWVQNTPSDMETVGLSYNRANWNVGMFSKRVGKMWNDNGALHQAVAIDPFYLTNLFLNYTVGGTSRFASTRIRLAVNNVGDSHAITGVTPASARSNAPADGDVLVLMSGRSVSVSVTFGLSPRP